MKKVLIITYYFPPCGGIGVLRCLKLAKYLREFGWEPIIYTAEDAHYPSYDESNLKDIPPDITILRQPIFEPYTFYKKFTKQAPSSNANNALVATDQARDWKHKLSVWIRSNFFIPDARAFWIKPSVNYLINWLKEHPVEAILSDGPPHTNTMIACEVSAATQIPWLMDFQDPWTQVDYYQRLILTAWADRKHHRLEQIALKTAHKTTIASPQWKKDLEQIGGKNVDVWYWGYDEADFQGKQAVLDQKLTITHAGLLGDDRNPVVLFEVVAELVKELGKDFEQMIEIQLIGQVDSLVKKTYEQIGISHLVTVIPQVNRDKALQYMLNSQVLLLLLNQAHNAMGRIPGKLFEYLAAQRPILCLGLPESDVDKLLQQTAAGTTLMYTDKQPLKAVLRQYYEVFRKEGRLHHQNHDITAYTHRNLTCQVAKWLDSIAKGNMPKP